MNSTLTRIRDIAVNSELSADSRLAEIAAIVDTQPDVDDAERYHALRRIVINRMSSKFGQATVSDEVITAAIDREVDNWIIKNRNRAGC